MGGREGDILAKCTTQILRNTDTEDPHKDINRQVYTHVRPCSDTLKPTLNTHIATQTHNHLSAGTFTRKVAPP